MTILASDGYEYADLTQRLLGQPLKSQRNVNVQAYRQRGFTEAAIRAYIETFDRLYPPESVPAKDGAFDVAHSFAVDAAYATGGFGPPAQHTTRRQPGDPGRTRIQDSQSQAPPGLHPTDQPQVPGRLGP